MKFVEQKKKEKEEKKPSLNSGREPMVDTFLPEKNGSFLHCLDEDWEETITGHLYAFRFRVGSKLFSV